MGENVRIWVDPLGKGRIATWVVICDSCENVTLPARRKKVAELIAQDHAREAHQGRAVVAVRKK